MIMIHQIYYDARTKAFCDASMYPYENKSQDEFFENTIIRDIYKCMRKFKSVDYVGVLSWKQFEKTHIYGSEIISRIQGDMAAGTEKDVYLLTPVTNNNAIEMISNFPERPVRIFGKIKGPDGWREHWIRNEQLYLDDKMLNDAGILPVNLFDGRWQYSKCNYWIVRRHVFMEYVESWLIPAMDFLHKQERTMRRNYRHSSGRDITNISFVLEYLFGSFLAHSEYSFEYLVKKKYPGLRNRQWVEVLGFENTYPLIEERGVASSWDQKKRMRKSYRS